MAPLAEDRGTTLLAKQGLVSFRPRPARDSCLGIHERKYYVRIFHNRNRLFGMLPWSDFKLEFIGLEQGGHRDAMTANDGETARKRWF
jgi:hypothetical protein